MQQANNRFPGKGGLSVNRHFPRISLVYLILRQNSFPSFRLPKPPGIFILPLGVFAFQ
jgi:hypothetical protein